MVWCGIPSSMITAVSCQMIKHGVLPRIKDGKHQFFGSVPGSSVFPVPILGFSSSSVSCRASEVACLETTSPNIVVNEAGVEDCWEVAEIHCSVFFPDYSFPVDLLLRIDRVLGMLIGFSVPKGCKRTCLVAVAATPDADAFCFEESGFKTGRLGNFRLHKRRIVGILTVDTVADFLPRRRRQRRTGIAYISNVAVPEQYRRKGIAKRLILKAVGKAAAWGCRAIALHCDLNNEGATKLYMSLGFKRVRVPDGANWPLPRNSAEIQFNFMMKLI